MSIRTKLVGAVATIAMAGMLYGCGGGGSSSSAGYVQTGKLVGGPVVGATVFADNVAGGVRFVQDTGEIAALTISNGSTSDGVYTLPQLPAYTYILVSRGGVDKITNVPAIQMLAPAGARNITPLTTLVTLAPDATAAEALKIKLQSLLPAGTAYDADVSESSSQAVLLLVKSIETATRSLTDTIVQQSGNTADQMAIQNAYIQSRIMQAVSAMASDATTTVADLTTPSLLTAKLTTALGVAIQQIRLDNQSAVTGGTAASTIAINSVTAAVDALGNPTASSSLNTAVVMKESSLLNAASMFFNAVATTVTQIIGTTITSVLAPGTFVPPVVPVFTITINQIITGATGGTGGAGTGTQF